MPGGDSGASDAADAQVEAANIAARNQREMLERQLGLTTQYRDAGLQGLEGLLGLLSPEGRNQFLGDYFNSAEFDTLNSQSLAGQLAAGEATGSLGGSSMQNNLGRIAPNLGLSALQNQLGQYTNLVGTGLNATGMAGGAMQNAGNALSDLALQRGAYQAGGIMAGQQAQQQGMEGLGQLAGTGLGYYFGGAPGAAAGGQIGGFLGGLF